MRLLPLFATMLIGCSATFDDKGAGATGTTGDSPGDGEGPGSGGSGGGDDGAGGSSIDDLDDLKSGMQANADGCQEVDGVPHPGAASYFYGELEPVESDGETRMWRGSEEWILFSNASWRDTGVSDCTITWNIQGEETEAGTCAACDLSIAVAATVDMARTSCPNGLWEDDANYSESYDIRLDDTGTSTWFFGRSGNTMGTGSWDGLAMNYLTARTCVWF